MLIEPREAELITLLNAQNARGAALRLNTECSR